MGNLFCYELRRLLNSKLLAGILLICLGYGWLTLTHVTVQGLPIQPPSLPGASDTTCPGCCPFSALVNCF